MYLNVKCKCCNVDLVLDLTVKQVVHSIKMKPTCEECGNKYKLKPMFTYDKTKYITWEGIQ